jgi:EAL domain-containing protein (putative c-di-GMP-specific phosphodiesterase class I)
MRWLHPERGLVMPAEFIPLAEETGLILPMTDWALEQACRLRAAWHSAGIETVPIAVNVAAPFFMVEEMVEKLLALLRRYAASPDGLILEITESLMMREPEAVVARMNALREHGFRLSLDDFGTGYSSLSYVKNMPLDELKIDRSFISAVHQGGKDHALVASIITLGNMLGMNVVAEGVETQEQAATLSTMGCHLHQGYLYARPIQAERFAEILALNTGAAGVANNAS